MTSTDQPKYPLMTRRERGLVDQAPSSSPNRAIAERAAQELAGLADEAEELAGNPGLAPDFLAALVLDLNAAARRIDARLKEASTCQTC